MSLFKIFNVAGSGMDVQNVRLNTTASNLANAETVSGSEAEAYRARRPVFAAQLNDAMNGDESSVGVAVTGVLESQAPAIKEYNPNHPKADQDGYIYRPNVSVVEEMADMISASRSYQTNVQIADTAKNMLLQTLKLGKG